MLCLILRKQVQRSKMEAERDGIKVPITVQEYCVKSKPIKSDSDDLADFYDDDYADDVDDDDDDECMEYSEDSGNEETWQARGLFHWLYILYWLYKTEGPSS